MQLLESVARALSVRQFGDDTRWRSCVSDAEHAVAAVVHAQQEESDRSGPVISKMNPPSPWIPEDNKVALAVLGKLLEEVNELGSALARCVIQGAHGVHPVTGKQNLVWLTEEIADVVAGCEVANKYFELSESVIAARMVIKIKHKLAWHKLIEEAQK